MVYDWDGDLAQALVAEMTLPEIAAKAGYTVISNNAPTVMEISGLGNWSALENYCHKWVKHTHAGHHYDHVCVIYRYADGNRSLRDIGTGCVRYGDLPSVCECTPVHRGVQGMWGVRKMYRRYAAQITAHGVRVYLGTWPTARDAAVARDNYVWEHSLTVPLNYPEEVVA